MFGLGAPPASFEVETPVEEEDWSDLGQPAEPRPEPEMELDLGAPQRSPPAPIELPEEPGEEPELAPMHAFVPPPEKVGHKPEAPAAAAAGDGGEALSKASRDVIERVVWEVVPQLAETIIRENLDRLVRERQG
jgi:hypothetical protein